MSGRISERLIGKKRRPADKMQKSSWSALAAGQKKSESGNSAFALFDAVLKAFGLDDFTGKTVKKIIAIAGIRESTLQFYNQNVYGKSGVSSRDQLLRYAVLMQ